MSAKIYRLDDYRITELEPEDWEAEPEEPDEEEPQKQSGGWVWFLIGALIGWNI